MKKLSDLKIKLFADGADVNEMKEMYNAGIVKGFTTNPTLMRSAGIENYEAFAKEVLAEITDYPISFEVFSDDFDEMEQEARKIYSWGENVNVKIPITNTKGESSIPLIRKLSADGLYLNITAILPVEQVREVVEALSPDSQAIVSVFAGRIADSGRDPVPYMKECTEIVKAKPKTELLWASSRELLNVFQAEESGAHIITVTTGILKKLKNVGRDLGDYSLDTVQMFQRDAAAAGYKII
jgi:transaldolase